MIKVCLAALTVSVLPVVFADDVAAVSAPMPERRNHFASVECPSTGMIDEIVLGAEYRPERLRAFGTAGLTAVDGHSGSYMFLAVVEPFTRRGVVCGWLTNEKASGIVKSGVRDGRVVITPLIEGGKSPAEKEIFVFGEFDDCRLGLEAYADMIAAHYGVKLPRQPGGGYCTWYSDEHRRAGDEASTAEFVAAAERLIKPWGFEFFQIDDGWQLGKSNNGPNKNFNGHDPQGPYPSGMKQSAERIAERGFVAGIWFMPFAGSKNDPFFADKLDLFIHDDKGNPIETVWGGTCFDTTDAAYRKYLREMVARISKEWGYRYFKCDGIWMPTGCAFCGGDDTYHADDRLGRSVYDEAEETPIGAYRSGLAQLREAAGDDVFIMICNARQNMRTLGASYGLVDAFRIGTDNGARWTGEHYTMLDGPVCGANRYFYNGRVWYNDPDPVYVRASLPLSQCRTLTSWAAIAGGLFSFADWVPKLPDERLELLRRTLAPHRRYTATRPIDLFESPLANAWSITVGRQRVFGLFNWSDTEPLTIDYEAAYAGLESERTYVGFDFWGNRFVPPFKGRLQATLAPTDCLVLAVAEQSETEPVLVSTSRHVASPVFDVRSCEWDAQSRVMKGVSEVVGGEAYELRFCLPKRWRCLDGETVGETARVRFTPTASGKFAWQVRFAAPD